MTRHCGTILSAVLCLLFLYLNFSSSFGGDLGAFPISAPATSSVASDDDVAPMTNSPPVEDPTENGRSIDSDSKTEQTTSGDAASSRSGRRQEEVDGDERGRRGHQSPIAQLLGPRDRRFWRSPPSRESLAEELFSCVGGDVPVSREALESFNSYKDKCLPHSVEEHSSLIIMLAMNFTIPKKNKLRDNAQPQKVPPPTTRCVPDLERGIIEPRIPRRMMQTHKRDVMPLDMRVAMESWKWRNYDYGYEYFSDEKARTYIAAHFTEDVTTAFDLVTVGAFKADLFRLLWLFHSGGIFLDGDSYAGARFSETLDPTDRFVTALSFMHTGNFSNLMYIFQAFMGSEPGHPIVRMSIDVALRVIMRRAYVRRSPESPLHGVAGPEVLHVMIRRYAGLKVIVPGHIPRLNISILAQHIPGTGTCTVRTLIRTVSNDPKRVNTHVGPLARDERPIFWNRFHGFYAKKKANPSEGRPPPTYSNAFRGTTVYLSSVKRRWDDDVMRYSPSELREVFFPTKTSTARGVRELLVASSDGVGGSSSSVLLGPAFDHRFDGEATLITMTNVASFRVSSRTGLGGFAIGCVAVFEKRREQTDGKFDDFVYDDLELQLGNNSKSYVAPNDGSRVFVFRNLDIVSSSGDGGRDASATMALRPVFYVDRVYVAEVVLFADQGCKPPAYITRFGG